MTDEQFAALKPCDLVRHKHGSSAFIVHANYGGRVTAVRVADLTNPSEWDVVQPDGSVIEPDALASAPAPSLDSLATAKARLSIAAVRARNSGQEKASVIADDVAVLLAAHSDLDRIASAPAGDEPARIDRGASEALGEMVWTTAPAGDGVEAGHVR